MAKRFTIFGLILLAAFFAFGDQVIASKTTSPEVFINEIGQGIGKTVSSVASKFGSLLWS